MSENAGDREQGETKESLELEKLRVEISKASADRIRADLEAAELRRWWYRPAFLQPFATVLITLTAAIVGYLNGFFTTESLKARQTELQNQILVLKENQTSLKSENARLTSTLAGQRAEATRAVNEAKEWERQVRALEPEAAEGRKYKRRLLAALNQITSRAGIGSNAQPVPSSPASSSKFSSSGVLTFNVVSRTGDGLADVGVEVLYPANHKPIGGCRTDQNGRCRFALEPHYASGIEVRYSRDGYVAAEESFTAAEVASDQLTTVTLIKRAQP